MSDSEPAVPCPTRAWWCWPGRPASGKSTWAAAHYARSEIVSTDALRAVVGTGPADLDASTDAFAVADLVIDARLRRGLTTVVDTLGLDPDRRRNYRDRARTAGLPAVLVILDTPARLCRTRNAERDRPVPADVLTAQLRRVRTLPAQAAAEGWDRVVVVTEQAGPADPAAGTSRSSRRPPTTAGAAGRSCSCPASRGARTRPAGCGRSPSPPTRSGSPASP